MKNERHVYIQDIPDVAPQSSWLVVVVLTVAILSLLGFVLVWLL